MKKLIISTITNLQNYDKWVHCCYNVGVDILDKALKYDDMIILLLARCISEKANKPKIQQAVEDELSWWLYSDVDKIIIWTKPDGEVKLDLEDLEDFAEYLLDTYVNMTDEDYNEFYVNKEYKRIF